MTEGRMTEGKLSEVAARYAGPLRVLVVEDESRLRDMLVRAITDMGFAASGVASAEAALRAFAERPIDIALLDLNLPGMSGMELLERLRRQHADVQAIVLTGFGDLETARTAMHLDAVDFLTKPCALGDLEVSLDRARSRLSRTSGASDPASDRLDHAAPAGSSLEAVERSHILSVLEKNHGNRAATAAELGISLRKLYYRLEQYQQEGLLP